MHGGSQASGGRVERAMSHHARILAPITAGAAQVTSNQESPTGATLRSHLRPPRGVMASRHKGDSREG